MLKLKLQYFGHLTQSRLIGKDPDAGRDGRQKETRAAEDEMNNHSITEPMDVNLQEILDREAWGAAVHGAAKSWTCLNN